MTDRPRGRVRRIAVPFAAAGTATVGLTIAVFVSITDSGHWDAGAALLLARGTGWCALGALALALVATPARRIARRLGAADARLVHLPRLRRAFGITAASLASLHAAISLGGHLDGSWSAITSWPYLRAGLVSLLVLLALLVTSFPTLVRRLRVKLWKPLHRLAYVAAILAALHVLLSPFAPRAVAASLFVAIAVIGLGRLLPTRASPAAKSDRPATARAARVERS